jgi:hypothetical protein
MSPTPRKAIRFAFVVIPEISADRFLLRNDLPLVLKQVRDLASRTPRNETLYGVHKHGRDERTSAIDIRVAGSPLEQKTPSEPWT